MEAKSKIMQAALAGAFVVASSAAFAQTMDMPGGKGKEKCHGVAKKGQNDCGTATHGCAGKAAKDYDEKEWKFVKAGLCKKIQEKVKAKLKKKAK